MASLGSTALDLYNNDDLERELEALAQDEEKQKISKIASLPDVPTKQSNDPLLQELEALVT